MNVSILVPVWNDWECASLLCHEIVREMLAAGRTPSIWLVDDGSATSFPSGLPDCTRIIRLNGHFGHQRAIAAGMGYLCSHGLLGDALAVMDGDGEDRASDLLRLLEASAHHSGKVIVALRGQRHSGFAFRWASHAYRFLFSVLTRREIGFGNFLLLPPDAVARLCASRFTPRHMAAAILKTGVPYVGIEVDRGRRYSGRSRMSVAGWVHHAWSAFAVYFGLTAWRFTPAECARQCIADVH